MKNWWPCTKTHRKMAQCFEDSQQKPDDQGTTISKKRQEHLVILTITTRWVGGRLNSTVVSVPYNRHRKGGQALTAIDDGADQNVYKALLLLGLTETGKINGHAREWLQKLNR